MCPQKSSSRPKEEDKAAKGNKKQPQPAVKRSESFHGATPAVTESLGKPKSPLATALDPNKQTNGGVESALRHPLPASADQLAAR